MTNTNADSNLKITSTFPGLPVRPIGPGDDVVISEEAFEDWLLSRVIPVFSNRQLRDQIAETVKKYTGHTRQDFISELYGLVAHDEADVEPIDANNFHERLKAYEANLRKQGGM